MVQLSIKAVERTLDKMAVLVLTKEDLIKWSVSGELNQRFSKKISHTKLIITNHHACFLFEIY